MYDVVFPPRRGASHSGNSGDVVVKLEELRQHKEEVEREERELDEQCQRMKQCLKNITEDTYSDEYPLRCVSLPLSLSLSSFSPSLPPSIYVSLFFSAIRENWIPRTFPALILYVILEVYL
jgi:hypothetical protein